MSNNKIDNLVITINDGNYKKYLVLFNIHWYLKMRWSKRFEICNRPHFKHSKHNFQKLANSDLREDLKQIGDDT